MPGRPDGAFQFLIGRLQTSVVHVVIRRPDGFQFLIGRLQTGPRRERDFRELQFQFLIGRLQTRLAPSAFGLV